MAIVYKSIQHMGKLVELMNVEFNLPLQIQELKNDWFVDSSIWNFHVLYLEDSPVDLSIVTYRLDCSLRPEHS